MCMFQLAEGVVDVASYLNFEHVCWHRLNDLPPDHVEPLSFHRKLLLSDESLEGANLQEHCLDFIMTHLLLVFGRRHLCHLWRQRELFWKLPSNLSSQFV